MFYLQESAVVLHKPPAGFDLDLTLERGRVYLSNRKKGGPARARVRFAEEVWDSTLRAPGAELSLDIARKQLPPPPEPPGKP
jgi:hypothetical protein